MASRLIFPAADMYASISAGDIPTLRPCCRSRGSNHRTAGMSWHQSQPQQISNRVRILGAVEAVESWRREDACRAAVEFRLHPADQRFTGGGSGLGIPPGGIIPARSFRTTFSASRHDRQAVRDPTCRAAGSRSSAFRCGSPRGPYRGPRAAGKHSGPGAAGVAAAGRGTAGAAVCGVLAGVRGAGAWPDTRTTETMARHPVTTALLNTDIPPVDKRCLAAGHARTNTPGIFVAIFTNDKNWPLVRVPE